MLIRRERPDDLPAVTAVTGAAFAGRARTPVPVEVTLLDELRGCDGWLPALSLVAEGADGKVTGHVVCTRGRVGERPALGLGPLSVHPGHQRRGVGSALVHTVLGAADALGEPLVALLGEPAYYGRFGFRAAAEYGITPPDPAWGRYFQVRTLTAYGPEDPAPRGTFAYAEPFGRV
ncbi:GNAT family N-acetyltransferase [Streptomyces carminius]|uniref:GNAT family N-acetyltransferase n=1 Tax=Streptomyces carminius TaxID=2665496 RepID=A0A2M8M4V9_9ACTN|nr:N-acetyltransferase [Streptomyces carminius]PJE99243.1 GNAT family N-acetyltransferase [Streptomyces carminius]